ncbi:hypothetical protein GEMRC1_011657 [Eukaryota sp. GEM-RC1]
MGHLDTATDASLPILLHRGKQALIKKHYSIAINFLTSALEFSPKDQNILYYRALAHMQSPSGIKKAIADFRDLQASIRRLSSLLRVHPRYADGYLARGELFLITNQHEKALPDFLLAASNSIDIAPALCGLALCHLHSNAPKQALSTINHVIDLCHDTSDLARHRRGLINFKLGHFEDALDDFSHSLDLNAEFSGLSIPTLPEPLFYRAVINFKRGKSRSAITDLDLYHKSNPSDQKSRELLARMFFGLGDYQSSYDQFKLIGESSKEVRSFLVLLDVILNLRSCVSEKSLMTALLQTCKENLKISNFLVHSIRGFCHGHRKDVAAAVIEYKLSLEKIDDELANFDQFSEEFKLLSDHKYNISSNIDVLKCMSLVLSSYYDKSIMFIDRLIDSRPFNQIDFLLMKSFAQFKSGNTKHSLTTAFKLILEVFISLLFLCSVTCGKDRFADAVSVLDVLIDSFDSTANLGQSIKENTRLFRALCLVMDSLETGDKTLAEKARIDCEISSSSPQSPAILGKCMYALGNYKSALSLHVNHSSSFELASLYWSIGKPEEALKCLDQERVRTRDQEVEFVRYKCKLAFNLKKFDLVVGIIEAFSKGCNDYLVSFDRKAVVVLSKVVDLSKQNKIDRKVIDPILTVIDDLIALDCDGYVFHHFVRSRFNVNSIQSINLSFNQKDYSSSFNHLSRICRGILKKSSLSTLPEHNDTPSKSFRLEVGLNVVEAALCNRFDSDNDVILSSEGIKVQSNAHLSEEEILQRFEDGNLTDEDENFDNNDIMGVDDLSFLERFPVTLHGNSPIKIDYLSPLIEIPIGCRKFLFSFVVPLPDISPMPVVDVSRFFPAQSFEISNYVVNLYTPWKDD